MPRRDQRHPAGLLQAKTAGLRLELATRFELWCGGMTKAATGTSYNIHLDAVGGIAGDMFVAAMLDAFPDLRQRVLGDTAAVIPSSVGVARLEEGTSAGLRVLRFGLASAVASSSEKLDRGHHHDHVHPHDHSQAHGADAGPGHALEHAQSHAQPSHFPDMVENILSAPLAEGTAREAVAILTILAEAEARVHGVPLEEVHFHEIADWDSLLDVVAAGSIAAALAGTRWTVSPLPLGGGLVRTQHGLLPVPAPATTAILAGFAWRDDGVTGERVTPTGAAILRHLVGGEPGSQRPIMTLRTSGTGAGTRQLEKLPNILRAAVFNDFEPHGTDMVTVISFDIDDMTGEEIGVAVDRLRTVPGILDVSTGGRFGKKGRPLTDFRLIVEPASADAAIEACLLQTSTIGLRIGDERRRVLARAATVDGASQRRIKSVLRPGGIETRKVESDDIQGLATLPARRKAAREQERE